jgi:hypothetical protein
MFFENGGLLAISPEVADTIQVKEACSIFLTLCLYNHFSPFHV